MTKKYKKQDQAARVAWLYYVANKTQLEIAKILGLSRQVVQRLLSSARDSGMVNIKITHPIIECLGLAQMIEQKYGLELCRVVPSFGLDSDSMDDMISAEGSVVMQQFINNEIPQIIGVGSGRTLSNIIDILPYVERQQHVSVSLIGAIARDGSATRYDVPLKLAEKMQSKYFIIPAPLYAEDPQDKQMWCQHNAYQIVKQIACQSHVIFTGIGEVGKGCPLNIEGFITDQQAEDLVKQGAVAEILGYFIDINGNIIVTEFDELTTSIRLMPSQERQIIAFTAGSSKYQAIKAALNGKWISGLVTDEETALKLIREQ